MKNIAIYCGANLGTDIIYEETAEQLAKLCALKGIGIAYGGASVGLMGIIADASLHAGGKVYGVMPSSLGRREITHLHLTKLYEVDSMHDRKVKLYELSDGFIAMPGGLGTLDELFEALTWGQLGLHQKPVGILNINHYYDKLLSFLDDAVQAGFLRKENREMILDAEDPEELLQKMEDYVPKVVPKWINKDEL